MSLTWYRNRKFGKVILYFCLVLPFFDDVWKPKWRTHQDVYLETKRLGKEPVTDEDERLFWEKELLGCGTANFLLNSVYYFSRNIFRLRGSELRNLSLKNLELGPNVIEFGKNLCKTFHWVLCDLKYVQRSILEAHFSRYRTETWSCFVRSLSNKVTKLFNSGVEEKLIRERTGHKCDA